MGSQTTITASGIQTDIAAANRLHPNIAHELFLLRTREPRNVLEWMFRYSQSRSPQSPMPQATRPAVVTTDFRQYLAALYDSLPAWVKADTPVLAGGRRLDWSELPDQAIRNLACWLVGVRELLAGRSLWEVSEKWPCRPARGRSVAVSADISEAEVAKKEE